MKRLLLSNVSSLTRKDEKSVLFNLIILMMLLWIMKNFSLFGIRTSTDINRYLSGAELWNSPGPKTLLLVRMLTPQSKLLVIYENQNQFSTKSRTHEGFASVGDFFD